MNYCSSSKILLTKVLHIEFLVLKLVLDRKHSLAIQTPTVFHLCLKHSLALPLQQSFLCWSHSLWKHRAAFRLPSTTDAGLLGSLGPRREMERKQRSAQVIRQQVDLEKKRKKPKPLCDMTAFWVYGILLRWHSLSAAITIRSTRRKGDGGWHTRIGSIQFGFLFLVQQDLMK